MCLGRSHPSMELCRQVQVRVASNILKEVFEEQSTFLDELGVFAHHLLWWDIRHVEARVPLREPVIQSAEVAVPLLDAFKHSFFVIAGEGVVYLAVLELWAANSDFFNEDGFLLLFWLLLLF